MARKPNYVKEFIPYSQLVEKMSIWRGIIASRFDYSKNLIENEYGVDADKVKEIFLMAWDMSKKDYPSPQFPKPSTPQEYESYNKYILYLWEYYVEDNEEPNIPDEPKIDNNADIIPYNKENKDNVNDKNERMYEGFQEEDLVDEEIDERILKLLGLDDTFDIDYGTYLTLLKEKMIAGRMTDSKLSSEETELLTNEYKRVKNNVGRFRIKKKPHGDDFNTSGPVSIVKGSFFAAQRVQVPDQQNVDTISTPLTNIVEDIASIRKTVENILDLMTQQRSLLLEEIKKDRRLRESQKRTKKESLLEQSGKAAFKIAQKILAPVQNILEKIIKFLSTVILGRIVYKLFKWMSDPNNKKKVDAILRFLKDWGPALLAGYLLFGTSIGKLVRTVIGTLTKLTFTMLKKGIPMTLNFLKQNPYVAAALVAAGAAYSVNAFTGQSEAAPVQAENRAKAQTGEGLGVQGTDTMIDKSPTTGDLGPTTPYGLVQGVSGGGKIRSIGSSERPIKAKAFSGGAEVSDSVPAFEGGEVTSGTGKRIVGAGKDTQLTALQPGEIVISKPAVNKFGSDFFLSLNKAGGGTNIPKIANNIQFASGGGLIGMSNSGNFNMNNNFGDNFNTSFKQLHKINPLAGKYNIKDTKLSPMESKPKTFIDSKKGDTSKNKQNIKQSFNFINNYVRNKIENENINQNKNTLVDRMPSLKNINNFMSTGDFKSVNVEPKNITKDLFLNNKTKSPFINLGNNRSPFVIFNGNKKFISSSINTNQDYIDNNRSIDVKNMMVESTKIPTANIVRNNKIRDIPISPPPKINLIQVSNEQIKKVKAQKSTGTRSVDTNFSAYYPSKTRSMLIQTYNIQGIE